MVWLYTAIIHTSDTYLFLQMLLELLDLNEEFVVDIAQLLQRVRRNVALVVFLGDRLLQLIRVSNVVQALALLQSLALQILLLHNDKHKRLVE